jgi:hypothetical protein
LFAGKGFKCVMLNLIFQNPPFRGSIQKTPSRTTDDDFLAKPSSVAILDALVRGLSIRATAIAVGVSPATVQKVKAASSEKDTQQTF